MIQKTKGLVLRMIKYGETSIIVTIYTESFGLQSYLVNGVRTASKKGAGKANMFQPASMLDLVVYQNELRNLQRIREFRYAHLYQHIFFDVFKNSVALFMVELLLKCVKQPEPNAELFYFVEEAFLHLDQSSEAVVANYSLYFSIHLAGFFGFRIQDDYSDQKQILDLQEGMFVHDRPMHGFYLDEELSFASSQLLKAMRPEELTEIGLNRQTRRSLLQGYQNFYALHIPDFGTMKTLPVLQAVFAE
jgi:DNA repair protein RecO (recombination protein O)